MTNCQISKAVHDTELYAGFYRNRIARGLPVDRTSCPYTEETLADPKYMRASMLRNPFEKFERKRFLYHSRDLGVISMNHALLARLTDADYDASQPRVILSGTSVSERSRRVPCRRMALGACNRFAPFGVWGIPRLRSRSLASLGMTCGRSLSPRSG